MICVLTFLTVWQSLDQCSAPPSALPWRWLVWPGNTGRSLWNSEALCEQHGRVAVTGSTPTASLTAHCPSLEVGRLHFPRASPKKMLCYGLWCRRTSMRMRGISEKGGMSLLSSLHRSAEFLFSLHFLAQPGHCHIHFPILMWGLCNKFSGQADSFLFLSGCQVLLGLWEIKAPLAPVDSHKVIGE
jgi:hypothetical protein